MRRHHDSVHTRPQRSRRLVIHRGNHLHADDPLLLLRTLDGFATIKKDGSQRVEPPTPVVLPPLVKEVLHEQHSQSDKHTLIHLAKESKRHSHTVILQRPSMRLHRGVIALSAICAQVSRTAPLASQSPLPIGTGITLPVYTEVA